MELTKTRRRKSERLSKKEAAALRKFVASFDTKIDAFLEIGITKPTMDIVLVRGTAHPDTCRKIRAALKKNNFSF